MSDYSLGTAEGTIKISYDGSGINQAGKGMDTLEGKAKNVQSSFAKVAASTGIAAAAIAGGLGLAVNAAIDFEKRISAIGAVSGATADQLDIIRKKALQLGADTSFSASEAALAMEELVKAGLSVDDVMNGAADATVALAAAGEVALPEAAAIASNAMNQFSLAAKDLPHIADLIAGAANASAIDVSEFGFAMAQAGAVANLVGLKFDDLATAIALMGNQGIKGSDAGTSLKTMLQNLQPTTKTQISLFRELGLLTKDGSNAFFDQSGHVKTLGQIAGILNTTLKGMTDQQKAMALETIFGTDAIRAAAIVTNAGAEGFAEMAAAMGQVSAQDVAAKRLDNVAGSIEQLKGSVETAAITIGTQFLPIIRKVTDFITMLVNKFGELNPQWQKLIAFGLLAGAALLGVIAVIAGIGAAIAGLAASAGALQVFAAIAGAVAFVIMLAASFREAYNRSEEFRNLLAKIGLVATTVFNNAKTVIKPFVEFIKNQLIPVLLDMRDKLQKNLEPALAKIGEFLQTRVIPAVNRLKEAFVKVTPTLLVIWKAFLSVAQVIMGVLGKALGFIIPLLINIIGPIFSALISVIANVIEFIPTLVNAFKTFLSIMKTVGTIIAIAVIAPFYLLYQVGKFVFEQLMNVVDIFVAAFKAVWSVIGAPVTAVFDLIVAIISLAFSVLSAVFQAWWGALKLLWDGIWTYIVKPVATAFGAVWDAIVFVFDAVKGFIAERWADIKAIWDAVYGWLVPPITKVFNDIKEFVSGRMDDAKTIVSTVWDAIVAVFTGVRDRLVNAIKGMTDFVNKVKAFFEDMKKGSSDKVDELVAFVKGLPGKILDALGNLATTLKNSGSALIQGFWDGIKSKWDQMVGWVTSKMETLRGLWPFSPAKYGPFSGRGWVLYSGRALMEGFATGMDDRAGTVRASAESALAGVAAQLPTDRSATVAASRSSLGFAAGSGSGFGAPTTTSTNSTEININVPLEDLRSIRDVQDLLDFIDRLRNDSRRGLEVGV